MLKLGKNNFMLPIFNLSHLSLNFWQNLMHMLREEKSLSTDVILSPAENNLVRMYSWSTAGNNNCCPFLQGSLEPHYLNSVLQGKLNHFPNNLTAVRKVSELSMNKIYF